MAKIWILLLTLTISTLFIHVPHKGEIGFLFNSDVVVSYNQYVWLICQHLIFITLSAIIWSETKSYKRIVSAYVWLQVADAVMFVLAYDDPLKDSLITWNIIKLVIFVIVIGIEIWKPTE
jgi:hypothetical protein